MSDRDTLLDLAGRALAASEAGTTLFVSPAEFRLLKTMGEREWDAVVLSVWEVALRHHPKPKEILGGVIGQPWALPVVVQHPQPSGDKETP